MESQQAEKPTEVKQEMIELPQLVVFSSTDAEKPPEEQIEDPVPQGPGQPEGTAATVDNAEEPQPEESPPEDAARPTVISFGGDIGLAAERPKSDSCENSRSGSRSPSLPSLRSARSRRSSSQGASSAAPSPPSTPQQAAMAPKLSESEMAKEQLVGLIVAITNATGRPCPFGLRAYSVSQLSTMYHDLCAIVGAKDILADPPVAERPRKGRRPPWLEAEAREVKHCARGSVGDHFYEAQGSDEEAPREGGHPQSAGQEEEDEEGQEEDQERGERPVAVISSSAEEVVVYPDAGQLSPARAQPASGSADRLTPARAQQGSGDRPERSYADVVTARPCAYKDFRQQQVRDDYSARASLRSQSAAKPAAAASSQPAAKPAVLKPRAKSAGPSGAGKDAHLKTPRFAVSKSLATMLRHDVKPPLRKDPDGWARADEILEHAWMRKHQADLEELIFTAHYPAEKRHALERAVTTTESGGSARCKAIRRQT